MSHNFVYFFIVFVVLSILVTGNIISLKFSDFTFMKYFNELSKAPSTAVICRYLLFSTVYNSTFETFLSSSFLSTCFSSLILSLGRSDSPFVELASFSGLVSSALGCSILPVYSFGASTFSGSTIDPACTLCILVVVLLALVQQ